MVRYETKKIRENLCYKGVVLLRCELTYPRVNICESFFEKICEKCIFWAKEKLYPMLSEEYDSDTDPKKRFTSGYEYRVFIGEKESPDGYMGFTFSATVKKCCDRKNFFERKSDFTVRSSDGLLVSETLIKKYKKRQNKQKSTESTIANDEK